MGIIYTLIIMISMNGHDWQTLEEIQQPDIATCLNESAKRLEYNERKGLVVDKYNNSMHDAYEYSVSCNAFKPQENPL